jgi:serine/threonine protein kinase
VYSTVVEVVDISDAGKRYGVKILRKNEVTYASGCREYKLLSQMHASRKLKRIMKVYDMFEVSGHLAILCEFLGMDLRSFSHRKKATLADIRTYAIGMILIWHELRLSRVIHADIKPDNFLFKSLPEILDLKTN